MDSLGRRDILYNHFPDLGGRRKPHLESRNNAWRNDAFRGYADHMESAEFRAGIERLWEVAVVTGPTAIMCAEAVWWRCHRGLISDYLKVGGVEVIHIIGAGKIERHPWTSAARVEDGTLSYRGSSL